MNPWITSQDGLHQWLDARSDQTALALDTEFMRERTFYPQLALVQIGDARQQAALFDPLPEAVDGRYPRPGSALASWLESTNQIKVMHSASEDLQALQRYCGALPRPLFDTQIAAAMTGMGPGLGYQKLIDELVGVELDKSQTRSDWLQRPLSEAQQRYAAEDVTHLLAAYELLRGKLKALGRLAWLEEDCQRLLDSAANDSIDPQPQMSFRPAERMNAGQQAMARRLLLWRDARARQSDRPRTWILDNDSLLALVYRTPSSRTEFDQLLDAQKRAPRRGREALFDIYRAPLDADERDIPLAEPQSPWRREQIKPLKETITLLAERLELPEGLLCARRHLENLVAERRWPNALQGWRRELLEPELKPLLEAAGLGAD